jgi:hypothetical protein
MMRTAFTALLLLTPLQADWLLESTAKPSQVVEEGRDIVLTNGLIRRVFRAKPDCATVAFDNLLTGASMLRGVKPEALLTLNGIQYPVGGLQGQPDYAYLRPQWIDALTADSRALHCTGYEKAPVAARFAWKQVRYAANTQWPPKGAGLVFHFQGPQPGLKIDIHYEIYDGIPLLAKWVTLHNTTANTIKLDKFTSELLALVEQDSAVDAPTAPPSYLHVESDYAFRGMDPRTANRTTYWEADPQYETQVNYERASPLLLTSRPPLGPGLSLTPSARWESFRTFELALDSSDRERNGLARRHMYRLLAPWATENPILMHVRQSDTETVKRAIDQSADVGFEMVILSFGSGFNAEDRDPLHRAKIRELNAYAKIKGVELGGYSLLASRKIGPDQDVINPKTGQPGGAIFGNSPCLRSRWGLDYFNQIKTFYGYTELMALEHDGSYPGDVCASTIHPGHDNLEDSQWRQWEAIRELYHWSRERGIYLNVPDWYFLQGSNKVAMGYRETNWSLPRDRQFILGRQNIYDGTWDKSPSMGWMFVPLTQYHGGGEAATLEPLKDHLDAYEQHLAQNFTAGVQACYRGPRLYDNEETRAVVKRWVDFYKAHRAILDSDIIHLRRPDGQDWDGLLHVNHALKEKGLAVFFNPTGAPLQRRIKLPLYYTGLTAEAKVAIESAAPSTYKLARDYSIEIDLTIPAGRWTWLTIE